MTMLEEIVEWSKSLPAWQSDALRRLFLRGKLTEADEAEILAMAKTHHGISQKTVPPAPVVLQTSHLPTTSSAAKPTILLSMKDVKNVNALATGQEISFGPTGLSIVYGGNGTGKSGYARVLKRACRARDGGEPILANVRGGVASGSPQASFTVADKPENLLWRDGDPTPTELAEIAVLDSNCARLFIDEAAEIAHTPYGLDVFPKLAKLLTALKGKLEIEMDRLGHREEALFQEFSGPTKVGELIVGLSAATKLEDVNALAKLSEAEVARLEELEKQVAELKANDPQKESEILRRLQRRLENYRVAIVANLDLLGAAKVAQIRQAWADANAATRASEEASKVTFDQEALPEIGSNPWRSMFKYAAEYSALVYRGREFPYVGEDGRCVLCQQPLSQEAGERLKRFWAFIRDRTMRDAQEKREVLDKHVRELRSAPAAFADSELVLEIQNQDPLIAELARNYPTRFNAAREVIFGAIQKGEWTLPQFDFGDIGNQLSGLTLKIGALAEQKAALSRPEEAEKITKEFVELQARKKLAQHKEVILRHIEQLVEIGRYRDCIESLRTTAVTKTGRDLTDKALTHTLKTALTTELEKLEMMLPLDFRQTAAQGQTKHQLQIQNAKPPRRAVLSDILSEGEQHVIALAAFMAELDVAGLSNSVIFDDPVSSLDHRWMRRVSHRLVAEAGKRQVIVFTHNIGFVVSLKKEAARSNIPTHVEWLRRKNHTPGHCSTETPWEIMSVRDRGRELNAFVQKAKDIYASDPEGVEYRETHNRFYDRLRSTWERVVEESLLNEAVLRFRDGVETQRLSRVVIDDDDFKTVYEAMSKGSEETPAHDRAADAVSDLATPDDMKAEVERLTQFTKDLEKKQAEVGRRRKALLKPPAA
ncbi:AAA family ATPase [Patescibacteria group bacterium]|nr:AAA family ATPase [Patescibacteria group bacterium]